MKRDEIFRDVDAEAGSFEFDARVAEVFDDMLLRSVPFYMEQQHLVKEIGRKFWIEGTDVYDLGCSTGTTLINLCREIGGTGRFVGYDSSLPMVERARSKIREEGLQDRIEVLTGDLNGRLSDITLENAGVVTMCWTLQFIQPSKRDRLIRWIQRGLVEDGVLIVTEKVRGDGSGLDSLFTDFYHNFKRRGGYTEEEILRKKKSLENVLIPYRIDENRDLFRRNGFAVSDTFFQWFNFVGFICLKRSPRVEY